MLRAALVLLAFTAIGHLPMLLREVLYGTEAFRIQVAWEMAQSGDLLVPTLGGEPRLTKPPLHYWMLAGLQELFGRDFAILRLPGLLLTWLCGCVVWRTLARRFDTPTAWIGALGSILAPQILWHAAMAEIDSGFAALTAMSVLLYVVAALDRCWKHLLAAAALGALALLDKGPPYFMFWVGPLLWTVRRLGPVRLLVFLAITLAPILVYYRLLTSSDGIDADEFQRLARNESVGRVAWFNWTSLLEAPGHLVKAAVTVLPFSFWLHRLRHDQPGDGPDDRLFRRALLASFVGMVLILLIYPRRPSRYMLPAIPLIAAAAAPLVRAWLVELRPLQRPLVLLLRTVGTLAAISLLVLPWLPPPMPGRAFWLAVLVAFGAPLAARSRPGGFAALLFLPIVLIWTVRMDRERMVERGLRAEHNAAALMREELEQRAALDDFAFWRDPGENFALWLAPAAPWLLSDATVPPEHDFVVQRIYDGEEPAEELATDFVPRAHVRGRDRIWILFERR